MFHIAPEPLSWPLHSRPTLKKYVKNNNTINANDKMFDSLFNRALRAGVEKGEFAQPKGMFHSINRGSDWTSDPWDLATY